MSISFAASPHGNCFVSSRVICGFLRLVHPCGSRQHRLGPPRAVIRPVRGSVRGRLVAVVHGQPDHRDVLVGGPPRDQSPDEGFLAVLGGARHVADDDLLGTVRRREGLPGEFVQKVVPLRGFGVMGSFEAMVQVNLLEVPVVFHRRRFWTVQRKNDTTESCESLTSIRIFFFSPRCKSSKFELTGAGRRRGKKDYDGC